MLLVRKVIFHLFSLFEGLEPSDNLVVGVIILAISLFFTGFLVLIRTYIKSCISEIVNKELEKNPKCIEQRGKIQSLIRRHEEINNILDEIFPRKFVLQPDREDTIYSSRLDLTKKQESSLGFDEEIGEIIFRISLRDRIARDEIIEDGGNNGENKLQS